MKYQLLTFAWLGKIMRALNSWNYYAKLPLPHVIFNRLSWKYESLNTLLSSQWKLLFRTVTWCTAFTVTVTWCKLQGAVSDRDKKKRKKKENSGRGILPRILNYKDIKRASHWDLKVGYSIKQDFLLTTVLLCIRSITTTWCFHAALFHFENYLLVFGAAQVKVVFHSGACRFNQTSGNSSVRIFLLSAPQRRFVMRTEHVLFIFNCIFFVWFFIKTWVSGAHS